MPDAMQDYYAARAREYDRIYRKPERQPDLRRIEAWLADVLAGCSVLEVACGTGYWIPFYAPRARRVLGIDSADETLAIARARVPAEVASGKVRFEVADAYAIDPQAPPFDAAFDAAFAGFWWSHVPLARLPAFLSSLHAALAPGASVVFLDNRFVAGSSTPVSAPDADGNTWQTRRLDDGSSHRVLKNFPTREALLDAVSTSGRDARVHEWDHYWALQYRTAP